MIHEECKYYVANKGLMSCKLKLDPQISTASNISVDLHNALPDTRVWKLSNPIPALGFISFFNTTEIWKCLISKLGV